MRNYLPALFTLPWALVSWILLLLMLCTGFVRQLRWERPLVLVATFRDWWAVTPRKLPWSPRVNDGSKVPVPFWSFSTTVGRAIAYHPEHLKPAGDHFRKHEHVHIRQVEDRMLWSFLMGLLVAFLVGPTTGAWDVAWGTGGLLWLLGGASLSVGWIGAVLRGRHGYWDAEFERSAYAQTDPWGPGGTSWLDHNGLGDG